jgi:hypothetical protein
MHDLWLALPLQFRVLYRVFLLRVIDLEVLSADSDTTQLIGQFAGMFASFSLIISLPFILFGFPRINPPGAWIFEHFLIATTMLVSGLFAVLTWDAIFPDRRDVLILAPLPVRPSTIFFAKIVALLAAVALVVVSLNVVSGITFPLMFFPRNSGVFGLIRCIVTFWITIFAAGVFFFCSVVAIQGIANQLLPRQLFLRLSAFLQVILFCLFVATYFLEPSLESPRALVAPENQRILQYLPAYWFLGLFQQLNGSMSPEMIPLARRGWIALAAALFNSGSIVLLSYFRVMRKVIEQPDILPSSRRLVWLPRLGGSLKTALLLFSVRVLLRSRQHRVLLSFYSGVGLAIVLAYVKTPLKNRVLLNSGHSAGIHTAFLAASVLMLFLAFFGLRIVSIIPITLRANWVFRVSQIQPPARYLAAVRLTWLLLGVAPVWLVSAALLLGAYPWRESSKHLTVLALLGILLVEISLQTFRKIPFTCSYLPGKGNPNLVLWVGLVAFVALLGQAGKYESKWLSQSSTFVTMVLTLVIFIAAARYATRLLVGSNEALIFEEEELPVLISLKLN